MKNMLLVLSLFMVSCGHSVVDPHLRFYYPCNFSYAPASDQFASADIIEQQKVFGTTSCFSDPVTECAYFESKISDATNPAVVAAEALPTRDQQCTALYEYAVYKLTTGTPFARGTILP